MTRIATLYRRVSTARQVDEGSSLDAQHASLLAYCERRGWTIGGSYEDAGRTGRTREGRPGLDAAIAEVCANGGVLVAYSLSRFARSIIDAAEILRHVHKSQADLAIVNMEIDTSTPHGKLVFHIFAALAEWESEQTGERTKLVHELLNERAGFKITGFQAYGWRLTKVYEGGRVVKHLRLPHEKEQAVLARIEGMLNDGAGFPLIANTLNALGIPCPRAGRMSERGLDPPEHFAWKRSTVHRVWKNHQQVLKEMGLMGMPEAPLAPMSHE